MEDFNHFKGYFNSAFWKALKNNPFLSDIPTIQKERDSLLESVYQEIVSKKYFPSLPKYFIDINKGNFVTRKVPVFELKDYIVYFYCIIKLERDIALNRTPNTFGGWTLGGLLRKSEKDEVLIRKQNYDAYEESLASINGVSVCDYSFNPQGWVKAYGELNSVLLSTAKEVKYNFICELDIANFYDSIRLDILENQIRAVTNVDLAEIVNLLFLFLNFWNREVNTYSPQVVGLPQDAMSDCSRILANFYLQTYDKYAADLCEVHNATYMRYADDQFVFTNDREDAKYLIYKLSKRLNILGLSINQKKVNIMTAEDLIVSRSYKIFSIIESDEDKADVSKVESFAQEFIKLAESKQLDGIKNKGKSLISRLLSCSAFDSISLPIKTKVMKLIVSGDYIENTNTYYLQRIYEVISIAQKPKFIKYLDTLSNKVLHNSFQYNLLGMYRKNKIDESSLVKRIKELETL